MRAQPALALRVHGNQCELAYRLAQPLHSAFISVLRLETQCVELNDCNAEREANGPDMRETYSRVASRDGLVPMTKFEPVGQSDGIGMHADSIRAVVTP